MTSSLVRLQSPFVRHDAGRLRSALVVLPTAAFARALPVQGEASPIAARAAEAHAILLARLAAYGVRTIVLEGCVERPLGTLVADCAVIIAQGAVLMRPSDVQRRSEVAQVEAALGAADVPIVGRIEPPGLLDGLDVLVAGGTAYIGVPHARSSAVGIATGGSRSNVHGRAQLAALAAAAGLAIKEIPLAAEVRRLRSVTALVADGTVLIAAGLVDATALRGLKIVEAPRGEEYGAGVLSLGGRRVLANLRFRSLLPHLRAAKISVDAIDLWEFGKVGATPSALVLALKRD